MSFSSNENLRLWYYSDIIDLTFGSTLISLAVQITEGVQNVIIYPSANDKSKNRGFAFVEYDTHRSAAMARRKLLRQVQCERL